MRHCKAGNVLPVVRKIRVDMVALLEVVYVINMISSALNIEWRADEKEEIQD